MTIYILLILYLCALPIGTAYLISDSRKRERLILRMGMLAIFLLLALKKDTVGIDIAAYKQQYIISAAIPWSSTNYVYFELGYIQLMKLFSKAGLDFQVFAAFIYAVCCSAYYKFIERYSKNVTLSMLIFTCYQFLVFYTSGLRQALAMAICIYAFLILDGKWGNRWLRHFGAVLMVMAAATIHRSAWIFLAVIAFAHWSPGKVRWVMLLICLVASVAARPVVLRLINILVGEVKMNSGITLGGNFIFLMGMSVFCLVGYYQQSRYDVQENDWFLPLATNVLMMAVVSQILFSGGAVLRSTMYLTLFLIPGIPCALKCFDRRIEIILTWFLVLFLIVLFWTDTLSINQLNLLPYLFFWQ